MVEVAGKGTGDETERRGRRRGERVRIYLLLGFACSLLTSTMTIMIINAPDATETERQLLAAISQSEEVHLFIPFSTHFVSPPSFSLSLAHLCL